MEFSKSGIELLKQFEGCVLHVYKDSAGLPTIGVGHLIKPGEHFTTITEDEAEALLQSDLAPTVATVNAAVKVSLNQNQFDALVCFTFNVGRKAFTGSTLLRKLNSGDYAGAASHFIDWIHAGGRVVQGLVNRRNQERALFERQP